MNTLLGTKLDMTSRFDKNGRKLTLTAVSIGDNYVVEKKSTDKAGYDGVVIGTGKKKRAARPFLKKVEKIGVVPQYLKEIRTSEAAEVGTTVRLQDVLSVGDIVAVTGTTKGKGFAGVVKRYNFRGGPKTHGQSDRHRAPGSLGSGTTPGRVFKGKRMAGRAGGETSTVRNLIVAYINPELGQIFLSGPVPGHRNGLLVITKIGKNEKFGGIEELELDKNIVPEVVTEDTVETTEEVASEENVADDSAVQDTEDVVSSEETK